MYTRVRVSMRRDRDICWNAECRRLIVDWQSIFLYYFCCCCWRFEGCLGRWLTMRWKQKPRMPWKTINYSRMFDFVVHIRYSYSAGADNVNRTVNEWMNEWMRASELAIEWVLVGWVRKSSFDIDDMPSKRWCVHGPPDSLLVTSLSPPASSIRQIYSDFALFFSFRWNIIASVLFIRYISNDTV